MSVVLALTTSGESAAAALLKDGAPLEERSFCGSAHSPTVMPAIDSLLDAFSLECGDLDAIAVDIGPGSFTGMRIGVAAANGMALASEKPVIGVCSLLALRYMGRGAFPVVSMIDARNGNVYAAIYDSDHELLPPCVISADELIAEIPPNALCVGSGVPVHMNRVRDLAVNPRFTNGSNQVSPVCVGLAALDIMKNTQFDKSKHMQAIPFYLQPSQAERLKGTK